MFLVRRFYNQFDASVRERGQKYYLRRRVAIMSITETFVRALVVGSQHYTVLIDKTADSLDVSCTCPYFQDGRFCKHIWAAFVAADARGFLKGQLDPNLQLVRGSLRPQEDGASAKAIRSAPDPEAEARAKKRAEEAELAAWKSQILALTGPPSLSQSTNQNGSAASLSQMLYLIDVPRTLDSRGVALEIGHREMKSSGEWSKARTYQMKDIRLSGLTDPADREILGLLSGARESYYGYYSSEMFPSRYRLLSPIAETVVPILCRTGRCMIRRQSEGDELRVLEWDDGPAWEFWAEVKRDEKHRRYAITGSLRRGEERRLLEEPLLLTQGGLVFWADRVARLDDDKAFNWIAQLRTGSAVYVPLKHGKQLLEELLQLPHLPRVDLPPELYVNQIVGVPAPRLKIMGPNTKSWPPSSELRADLYFGYESETLSLDSKSRGVFMEDESRFVLRDRGAEQAMVARLWKAGFREVNLRYPANNEERRFKLNPKKFAPAVRDLVKEGWQVQAEGKLYRNAGNFRIDVTSGVDWFELHGAVEFGETVASLPELLAAAKRGENTVLLDDGTFGLLPEDWLKKYGLLAAFGSVEEDHIKFTRSQAGLLDALLASQPDATFDEAFASARAELGHFRGVEAADPPTGFTGELRAYQREGLGWLHFLQKFGFGGCLADCMGLGKTVMALALLESRRELRAAEANGATKGNGQPASKKGKKAAKKPDAVDASKQGLAAEPIPPSLLVVPRSLVFNWKQEAARFTPQMRVLDHTGMDRIKGSFDHFAEHDLIITTYGTLRRDAADFNDPRFDYVILDESQAVKNSDTESSKAVRLLKGNHKLALSGTPIENHLGELWSLFQFLNPGLLGSASVFKLFGGGSRNPDDDSRAVLAKALRPFILRRTKAQVAKDLPAKLEQTIYCEMEPAQRRLYDELRDHYRAALLGLIERRGIKQSKIQILEALLRLRQAACHPGLIDKKRTAEPSAKLDVLILQLSELMDEGHKVLVFSQFTSFLAIVRDRLDRESIVYEYLDGKTRDRQARVERFQDDPECKLFLISLKAGGLGLNLTSAEYVFLLDPWWNPAVEAQAIDRAHRIGQTRQVFAYRLITRGTVEEKVIELQDTKRNLADAIINADNSLIRDLSRQDLDLLFS
jgi:hypothetical protein